MSASSKHNRRGVRSLVTVVCAAVVCTLFLVGVPFRGDKELPTRLRSDALEPRETRQPPTAAPTALGVSVGGVAAQRRPFDLSRIRDPLRELSLRQEEGGGGPSSIKQIHHGIYKVTAMLQDGEPLTFAFKTECRPASKWHGQQGWSEVGVFHFTKLFYASDGAYASAPPARGVLVAMPMSLVATVVHRDRCGVVTEHELSVLQRLFPASMSVPVDAGYVLLAGVALTWQPRHDDSALPPASFASWFRPGARAELPKKEREIVDQISDVSLMDYLLSNEDREEKNWFLDAHGGRYIMMDNGWAFAGRSYKGSVCSDEQPLLACPPIMRHWDGPKCRTVANCRFRRASKTALDAMVANWTQTSQGAHSSMDAWVRAMSGDPLVRLFLEAYGGRSETKGGKLVFNEGLARYVQGCPGATPALQRNVPSAQDNFLLVVRWLVVGLSRRMEALQAHMARCVVAHGEPYVFG